MLSKLRGAAFLAILLALFLLPWLLFLLPH